MVPPVIFRVFPLITEVMVPREIPPPTSEEKFLVIKASPLKFMQASRNAAMPPPAASLSLPIFFPVALLALIMPPLIVKVELSQRQIPPPR